MVKAHHTKCTRARRAGFENSPKKKPSKSKQSKATPLKEAKTVGLVKKASTTFAVFLRENGLNMREGSDLAYRNHGYGMIWWVKLLEILQAQRVVAHVVHVHNRW